MDEQAQYKDNFLIPIMRKRINELYMLALDMEATIIFQNSKIKELTEKIDLINSNSNVINSDTQTVKVRKKSTSTPTADGGTF